MGAPGRYRSRYCTAACTNVACSDLDYDSNSQYEIWKNGPALLNCSKRPTSPIPPTSLPRISHPQLDGIVPTARSDRLAVGREGD